MLLLASSTDELRLTTSDAASIDVHVSYMDGVASMRPGRTNTTISTATTTQICAGPSTASTYRTVKSISVRNRHATVGSQVVLTHRASGSTDATLISARLSPDSSLHYDEHLGFTVRHAPHMLARAIVQTTAANTVGAFNTYVLPYDILNENLTANRLRDVKELGFWAVEGERYWFKIDIMYTSVATFTGSRWSINGPGLTGLRYQAESSLTTTTKTNNEGEALYSLPTAASGFSATTTSNRAYVQGSIDTPTASGLVHLTFASQDAGPGGITLKAGSCIRWQRVT